MNILFVSNRSAFFSSAFGGAETALKQIAVELAKRGHHVHYLTKRFAGHYGLGLTVQTIQGITIHSARLVPRERIERYHSKLLCQAISTYNTLQLQTFSRNLAQIIKEQAIDLVYCSYELNLMKRLLDLKKTGFSFKMVVRMAGLYWYEDCLKYPALIPDYERIFNAVDAVNYLNAGLKELVDSKFNSLKMKIQLKSWFIGDIGVKTGLISSVTSANKIKFRSNNQEFIMVMVARFSSYQKRQDLLVRAMALLPKEPPFKLILVGSGEKQAEIAELIQINNLADKVLIQPFLAQPAVWEQLSSANLLCHACEYEGISKVILESMSLGLPVLASNVSPLNEYIEDGVSGFLVENSPEAWAQQILALYKKQDLLKSVSSRAAEFVKQHYNPEENCDLYENHFWELLSLHT